MTSHLLRQACSCLATEMHFHFMTSTPRGRGVSEVFDVATSGTIASLQNSKLTILLVEDEPAVREITREALEQIGYRVLQADGPEDAIRVTGAKGCKIDLLLTDLVMPGMNGLVLAEHLGWTHPGLAAILMSGYAAHEMAAQLALPPTMLYIQKPFSLSLLCRRVRDAIAAGGRLVTDAPDALPSSVTEKEPSATAESQGRPAE